MTPAPSEVMMKRMKPAATHPSPVSPKAVTKEQRIPVCVDSMARRSSSVVARHFRSKITLGRSRGRCWIGLQFMFRCDRWMSKLGAAIPTRRGSRAPRCARWSSGLGRFKRGGSRRRMASTATRGFRRGCLRQCVRDGAEGGGVVRAGAEVPAGERPGTRSHRACRAIADLDACERIAERHVAEAVGYRGRS